MLMVTIFLLSLWAADAMAEDAGSRDFMGGVPSAGELIEALRVDRPHGEARSLGEGRGVQIETDDCTLVTRGLRLFPTKTAILDIKFEFGSDKLTGPAMDTLDQLGLALKAPDLASDQFVVEGHTDAVGSTAYNRELSKRRALTVRSYLETWHGIDEKRLAISCKGETELLDASDPASGVNRRVHIINAG